MRVIHEPGETRALDRRVLATDVEVADSMFARARGLMFRRSIPENYALVFHFGSPRHRGLHMMFVPFDIDAVWLRDGRVRQVQRLKAWRGTGFAVADTILELPAGQADGIEPGDRIHIE